MQLRVTIFLCFDGIDGGGSQSTVVMTAVAVVGANGCVSNGL